MTKHELMKRAIEEAREGIRAGHGGPFGTVIVKDGQIVGRAHNCAPATARWLPSETQVAIWAPTTSRVVNSTPRESLVTCASAPVCGLISVRSIMVVPSPTTGALASATISLTASLGGVRSSATTWRNWIARNVFSSSMSI